MTGEQPMLTKPTKWLFSQQSVWALHSEPPPPRTCTRRGYRQFLTSRDVHPTHVHIGARQPDEGRHVLEDDAEEAQQTSGALRVGL